MVSAGEALAIIALLPVGMLLFLQWALVWRWRGYVWADIDLGHRAVRRRYKPNAEAKLETKWGRYMVVGVFTTFRGLPLYRYRLDYPFPIRYEVKHVKDKDKKEIIETVNAWPVVIPAQTLATMDDQHTYRDIYQNRVGLMVLMFLGIVAVFLLVVGLYIRG